LPPRFWTGLCRRTRNNEVGRFLLSLGKTRKLEMSDLDFGLVLGAVGEEFGDFNIGKKISFFYPISLSTVMFLR